jgi:hypothetical protein
MILARFCSVFRASLLALLPFSLLCITQAQGDISLAPSHNLSIPLTIVQDFTIGTLTPATQTINAGQTTGPYNFSVLPVGVSFKNAVNLSCSSTPVISALCSFTPGSVTPDSSAASVVMTISTTSSSASLSPTGKGGGAISYALWLALPGLALLADRGRRKGQPKLRLRAFLLFLMVIMLSCGGGGSNGGGSGSGGIAGQQQGTQPGTYTITVIGTSGTLVHQAPSTVTLIVKP